MIVPVLATYRPKLPFPLLLLPVGNQPFASPLSPTTAQLLMPNCWRRSFVHDMRGHLVLAEPQLPVDCIQFRRDFLVLVAERAADGREPLATFRHAWHVILWNGVVLHRRQGDGRICWPQLARAVMLRHPVEGEMPMAIFA